MIKPAKVTEKKLPRKRGKQGTVGSRQPRKRRVQEGRGGQRSSAMSTQVKELLKCPVGEGHCHCCGSLEETG